VPAERNVRRPGRSATGTRGPKYRGALPLRTLYVSTATLYWVRSGTRSQYYMAEVLQFPSLDFYQETTWRPQLF